MAQFILSLIFVITSVAALPEANAKLEKVIEPYRYANFFIAGKLTPEIMRKFKEAGGETIVDVRDFSEHGECGEAAVAKKLKLKFFMSPLPKADPFTDKTVSDVEKIVAGAGSKPVLISCSTGNRAAGWVAAHLVRTKQLSKRDAIEVAKEHGMDSEFMEELLLAYLK